MSLRFKIDWDRDNDFETLHDDVTSRVRSRIDQVHLEFGRDQSTALAPITAGRGTLTLDNRSRDYSPRNSLSPVFGKVKPARPVKITRTNGANEYSLFRGHTDDSPINPDVDRKTVTLSLVDSLADLRGQTITTALYKGLRTGEAIALILDACGWSELDRDLDPGVTIMPWWWEENTDALAAIEKIIQSEGPPALVTMSPDNKIVFKDRHHRLHDAGSLVSQATFRAEKTSASVPYMSLPLTYDEAWSHIINSAINNIDVRQAQDPEAVFTSDTKIALGANQSQLITVSTNDPFYNAIVPVAGTDFILLSGAVTVTLFRTSGQSTTIKLQAGGSGATVENLQLRAQPVIVTHTLQVSALDQASINDYGARSFPTELPWCSPADAEAVLQVAVALRAQPLPIVHATFVCSSAYPAIVDKILSLDLSERVTVYEDELALSGTDFFIESIAHDLTDELDHRVTLGLEMVGNQDISPLFRFDTAGAGFNDGKFGDGIDDPSKAFQFSAVSDGGGSFAATVVQSITGTASGTGITTSVITTSAANVLILIVGRAGSQTSGAITGVTDPNGNTWQRATRGARPTGSTSRCEVWYTTHDVAAQSADAITVTSADSMDSVYTLVEVSGLNKADLVEAVSPDNSNSSSNDHHSTPDIPIAGTATWILAVINHTYTNSDTFTSAGGIMLSSLADSGLDFRTSTGYWTKIGAGTADGDFTLSDDKSTGEITVGFNLTVSGGSGIGFGHRFDEGVFVH